MIIINNKQKEIEFTPKRIVEYLNKYIIGQDTAKRKVAIALRNRIRRKRTPQPLQDEITPKNILMIGPTGVGKTEIARRLAKLIDAPFVKVEATSFTEVGYVGKNVDSMIRDLVNVAYQIARRRKVKDIEKQVEEEVIEEIAELILNPPKDSAPSNPFDAIFKTFTEGFGQTINISSPQTQQPESVNKEAKRRIMEEIKRGELDDLEVEILVSSSSKAAIDVFTSGGVEEVGISVQNLMGNLFPEQKKKKRVKVKDAIEILKNERLNEVLDQEELAREAVRLAEEEGIIFIDEIDKVAASFDHGPDVSREGVQRDLLPIVEGTVVMTKFGPVKTNHILFIAAGAFNMSKPSDIIPELQGRFPIRVTLDRLTKSDLARILVEPENSLIKQYQALLEADGVKVEFTQEAIEKIAEIAEEMNENLEDIGARRLHTIMEKVLEDILYEAPDIEEKMVTITGEYITNRLKDEIKTSEEKEIERFII